jgi:hypothetical protein
MYLDTKGLVALWREALLAQSVLQGRTVGYKNHPQLDRFKQSEKPLEAIGYYLSVIADEGDRRKYNFDKSKIVFPSDIHDFTWYKYLPVTKKQVFYEMSHLNTKLAERAPQRVFVAGFDNICAHPIFRKTEGDIESWEKITIK